MSEQALFNPIRRRLVGWIVLVVSLILLLLGASVYLTLSNSLLGQVDQGLNSRGDQAVNASPAPGGPPHPGTRDGYNGGTFFLAIGPDNQVDFNPQQVQVGAVAWPQPQSGGTLATVTINGEATRIFATRAPNGDTLINGESLEPEQAAIHTLLVVLVVGGGLGLVLSIWAAWFLSGRALIPIQSAFRRQQEFIADASHELRTPLTVLRSATDLLYQHRAEPLQVHADLLEDVRAEIARMQHLTQDLLTLARSDRGELQLMTAPMDLVDLTSDVVHRFGPLAAGRQQALEFHTDAAQPAIDVDVDPDRLQQVLVILVDNALKYTPEGGRVTVSVQRGSKSALVEVTDTGRGIAPEHLPRLFDRFYRADAARSRAAGGAGLGLSIARLLVEAHGSDLTLSSTVGVGTVATVRLPLAPQNSTPTELSSAPASTSTPTPTQTPVPTA
ncbi:MAG TPA: HAMP domain-containing sensor histidine kinase, partial [Chloroflexota bacterium]